ncbi:MAG: hypothetical protein AB7U20_11945 [Planctomycetaceae bacterium]
MLILAVMMLGAAVCACADEAPSLFSGPQVGEKLPPLKASLAYGEQAGEVVDLVELAAGRPTLLVIVNGSNRPAANLTRCLMNYAEMHEDKLFAATVYLADDLSGAETLLRQGISWWGMGPPIGVSVDGAEGPGSYGLNRNVNLTILVAQKGQVTANYPLIQPSLTDAPKILADVVSLIDAPVPTEPELRFLSMPTRKPGDVPWAAAPADVELRKLVCRAITAGTDDEARAVAAQIEQYVGDDKARQAAIGNVSSALLRTDTYQTALDGPMAVHLKRWRDAYDVPNPRRRAR